MNTCPHCNQDIEETPEPKGYALVSVDGKEQKVVDRIELDPKPYGQHRANERTKSIPVICIVER